MGTLTQFQKEQLPLLLIKGHTLREVSEMYGVSVNKISQYVKIQLERDLNVPLYFNSKTIPYYEDEQDYGRLPSYSWEELPKNEKIILHSKEPDA